MENSNIKAKYAWYCDEDIEYDEYSKFENISDLIHYKLPPNYSRNIKYNFGDLVSFSDYRDTGTYIIGKEGKLIANPDYSDSGYLTIPYEITQYLDNAVEKYSDCEPMFIDLRYDDKFIMNNINTKSCNVSKKWKFCWCDNADLYVDFPNGKKHCFDFNKNSAYTIKKWYEGSQKEQTKLKLYYEIKDGKFDEFNKKYKNDIPNIPKTWSYQQGSGGGGHKHRYNNLTYNGPTENKEKVINIIKKFYNGFTYTLTEA